MSGRLTIRFAPDMPPASVEVLGPDLATVGQMRMAPGAVEEVEVPSEGSFLRVHLPSGRVVTLRSDYSLDRTVHLSDVQRRDPTMGLKGMPPPGSMTRHAVRQYLNQSYQDTRALSDTLGISDPWPLLLGLVSTQLRLRADGTPILGRTSPDGSEVTFDASSVDGIMVLSASTSDGELRVQVPGSATAVLARADHIQSRTEGSDLHVAVQIATSSADADAVTDYLARGDMRSAESMSTWAAQAKDLLFGKTVDPYAAAMGGYLLLRLRRFEEMHDWARNVADWFPELPDGAVIWAWQLIGQRGPSAKDQIESYLMTAVQRGLPVYTEGLRLLSEALSMMGSTLGRSLSSEVNQQLGRSVWNSPFTAGVHGARDEAAGAPRVQFDISVAPRV